MYDSSSREEIELTERAQGAYSAKEWKSIRKRLAADPAAYGLPQREYGSLVLGSFNIRKLGRLKTGRKHERDGNALQFLADVCRHFDLLAVQEVMSSTESIRELVRRMGSDYHLIFSDVTGALPGGGGGLPERTAFIYDSSMVRRTQLVTDVTYDRFEVLDTLVREFPEIEKKVNAHRKALAKFEKDKQAGKKPKKPRLDMPTFLSFVRTPFAVGFEVEGHPGTERYEFLAVNAHLLYGDTVEDRQREGSALVKWIMGKSRESGESPTNVVLFGDLNLDYDKPKEDLKRLGALINRENKAAKRKVQASFPFLFPHPDPERPRPEAGTIFRTNVSLNQTFDQIGIFTTDDRLSADLGTSIDGHMNPAAWGRAPVGPDYGVFNFSELFANALEGMSYAELPKKVAFKNRYEFRVSDHLPIWYRFPLPTLPRGVNIST